jgi:NAD(P)H-flavin reductase
VLAGGGIGIVPLACWQDELGSSARVLLGFRDAVHAEGARLLASPLLATDDGTVGRHALVTELLAEELEESAGEAEVYACGPPAMLEVVRSLCVARDVPAQLALEAGMACGFGACFGCVVPTRDGYARVCVDGPVMAAAALEPAAAG